MADVIAIAHELGAIAIAAHIDREKTGFEKLADGYPNVIEILSVGTRKIDRRTKRDLYDRSGVREYWIVDPEADSITVHRRNPDGQFPVVATHTTLGGDTLTTSLLPGYSLDLKALFRR